jgi:hypothetical protein
MPILEFPAMFVVPEIGAPLGARIRFGARVARRAIRKRHPRRTRLELCVLTTSGPRTATLVAITLYGATLHGICHVRRRELVALRLPSGRRIKARVRWRFGKRCGLTFLTPVADFAPVLRESRAAHAALEGGRLSGRTGLHGVRRNAAPFRERVTAKARRLGRRLLRWCWSL